jgi:predicted ABC-type ATPase
MVVNIRGCNGSGKSTIPMSMMEVDPDFEVVYLGVSKTGKPCSPALTIFHKLGWIALGTYFNKTGGMDTYKNNADTLMALMYALKNYPEYDIVMEGVIASTIKSTYAELFQELEEDGHQVLVMAFLPPLEVCLERIQQRNGGKPIKEELVASKWRSVYKGVEYFRESGLTCLMIDTSKCAKERMLKNFLRTVDKYRR